jgi:hypothetical protein
MTRIAKKEVESSLLMKAMMGWAVESMRMLYVPGGRVLLPQVTGEVSVNFPTNASCALAALARMKLAAIAARNKVARRIDRLLFMEVSFCASFFFGFEASETA